MKSSEDFKWREMNLLVHPGVADGSPVTELLRSEPQGNLLLGRLDCVRSVADITANLDTEVSSDGAWLAVSWVSLAQHHTSSLNGVQTLPHHADNGAAGHVGNESGEESLLSEVGVVVLQKLLASLLHLHGDQLVSLLFEPLDDITDDAPVDAIRLDHDEGSLSVRHGDKV